MKIHEYELYQGKNDLFTLKEEEIPVYNGLVEKLNKGIEDLLTYKKELRDKGMTEEEITIFFTTDEKYKAMFKEHSEIYDQYMTIQENAIIRTNDSVDEHDNLDENDSR